MTGEAPLKVRKRFLTASGAIGLLAVAVALSLQPAGAGRSGTATAAATAAPTAAVPLVTPPGVTLQAGRNGAALLADDRGTPLQVYAGTAPCSGACTAASSPFAAPEGAVAGGDWTLVPGANGASQWAYRGKPLYRAAAPAGATAPPDWQPVALQAEPGMALPPGMAVQEVPGAPGFALVDGSGRPFYVRDGACTDKDCRLYEPAAAAQLAKPVGPFTVIRNGAGHQWAYRGRPLFTFAGDQPGEVKGDDAGGWQVALTARHFMPAGVTVRPNHYGGDVLAGPDGRTLYVRNRGGFGSGHSIRNGVRGNPMVGKALGTKSCDAACAAEWQPLVAPADARPSGYWDIAARDDGRRQWTYRGFAVYSFAGDTRPGDTNGNDIYHYVEGDHPLLPAATGGAFKGAIALVWHTAVP